LFEEPKTEGKAAAAPTAAPPTAPAAKSELATDSGPQLVPATGQPAKIAPATDPVSAPSVSRTAAKIPTNSARQIAPSTAPSGEPASGRAREPPAAFESERESAPRRAAAIPAKGRSAQAVKSNTHGSTKVTVSPKHHAKRTQKLAAAPKHEVYELPEPTVTKPVRTKPAPARQLGKASKTKVLPKRHVFELPAPDPTASIPAVPAGAVPAPTVTAPSFTVPKLQLPLLSYAVPQRAVSQHAVSQPTAPPPAKQPRRVEVAKAAPTPAPAWPVMPKFATAAPAAALAAAPAPAPRLSAVQAARQFRTWTDNTGKHHTRARILVMLEGKIRLLMESGRTTTVPLKRLSKDDLKFVENYVRTLEATATLAKVDF